MVFSKASSRSNDELPNLKTLLLSPTGRKLEQLSVSQSREGIQSPLMGQMIEISSVGRRRHRNKVAIYSYQRIETAIEQCSDYDDPQSSKPRQIYSPNHKTYTRIAELGADNETYKYTIEWLNQLRRVVATNGMWWCEPLINLGINSEIVFEWWNENKKLTVYILGNSAKYIKVWGADIDNEMEDGLATSPTEITDLWKWLSHEDLEYEPRLHRDDKFSVVHKPEVLFSEQIELQITDLPHWKPRITINRRMVETEDD